MPYTTCMVKDGDPMLLGPPSNCPACSCAKTALHVTLELRTDFVGSTNTINMLNFIDIYIFIPVSGCVGRGPSALLCPGAYNAVKSALIMVCCTIMLMATPYHNGRKIKHILLYWYFQQNQCLNIKKHAVHYIHRLA
jgi:hypothetical protein